MVLLSWSSLALPVLQIALFVSSSLKVLQSMLMTFFLVDVNVHGVVGLLPVRLRVTCGACMKWIGLISEICWPAGLQSEPSTLEIGFRSLARRSVLLNLRCSSVLTLLVSQNHLALLLVSGWSISLPDLHPKLTAWQQNACYQLTVC